MSLQDTTALEKSSLEAHVDLCALRYGQLETRLGILEEKMTAVQKEIIEGQKSLKTTIIATTGTLMAGLMSIVITLLMKF